MCILVVELSFLLGLATGATFSAPPSAPAAASGLVQDVTPNPAAPSARLRIEGSGFGSTQGAGDAVLVGGLPALVTQWDDATIIAYVPEATASGDALLEVCRNGVPAGDFTLTVEPRVPDGHVLWRFAVDADRIGQRVAVGPDGSIYATDQHGRLYKLSAGGGLVWIVDALRGQVGGGDEGPTAVGADGAVYAVVNPLGGHTDLVAYEPDGSLRWVFVDPASYGAAVGPALGPDGNVYVAFHAPGGQSLGLVSLTPAGGLRWTNPGSPTLYEHGAVGAELAFGASQTGGPTDQVVLTVDRDGDPHLYAFEMTSGAQRWAIARGAVEDYLLQFQIQPDVGPDGTVYMSEFTGLGGLGWGLKAFDPAQGAERWRFDPGINSGASGPSVGPDGTVYFSWDVSRVSAVTPAGVERWRHVDFDLVRSRPSISPRNDAVLVAGGNFGVPGRFKALSVADGAELWRVDLPHESGDVVPDAQATFTPDGGTAYFPTVILNDPDDYELCYLYALRSELPFEIVCVEDTNPSNAADVAVSGNVLGAPPIHVTLSNAPPNQFTYLLASRGHGIVQDPPGAEGALCLAGGGPIARYVADVQVIGAGGTATTDIENSLTGGPGYGLPNPPGGSLHAGETWCFQYWHRQPLGAPSSFSSAAAVTFE